MPAEKGSKQTGRYAGTNAACWSTLAECQFIDQLGKHAKYPARRVELLRGYIQGLRRRHNWGNLDRFEVLQHAICALERAEAMQ